jgi:acyl-CoA thioester hydrolase
VPSVYTARVTTRHDEFDCFGRLQPAVYLRYLSRVAVEASTAAGYDGAWYAAAGTAWLVRRSTLTLARPATVGEELEIRTWVEDFRRVRSHRRYEVHGAGGRLRLEARTDWVYVDAASGRPRRIPEEMEGRFGVSAGQRNEREPWRAAPSPAAPALAAHRVRLSEVDTFGHVNNAVYLDIAAQAMWDTLEAAGWPLDRLVADGGVPLLAGADLEYLEGARYGDHLEIATWFTPAPRGLDAHQRIARPGSARPLVNASTRWRWVDPTRGRTLTPPASVLAALRPVLAA